MFKKSMAFVFVISMCMQPLYMHGSQPCTTPPSNPSSTSTGFFSSLFSSFISALPEQAGNFIGKNAVNIAGTLVGIGSLAYLYRRWTQLDRIETRLDKLERGQTEGNKAIKSVKKDTINLNKKTDIMLEKQTEQGNQLRITDEKVDRICRKLKVDQPSRVQTRVATVATPESPRATPSAQTSRTPVSTFPTSIAFQSLSPAFPSNFYGRRPLMPYSSSSSFNLQSGINAIKKALFKRFFDKNSGD